MFFPENAVAVRKHWRTCPCLGSKPIKGKIHAGAKNIIDELLKEHYVDARCISKNPLAKPLGYYYLQKKVRCHNRQIHKMTIAKGGYRKLNQAPFIVKGFRLFDKVKYNNTECFIFGRRASGSFDIRLLDDTKISAGISCKKLSLISCRKNILIERKIAVSSHG